MTPRPHPDNADTPAEFGTARVLDRTLPRNRRHASSALGSRREERPGWWRHTRCTRWLFLLAVTPAVFGSPRFTSKTMNPELNHHVVTFPDCQLCFDYPANLKPSPDFIMQRMETTVDYDRIRWVTPIASSSFVELRADLRGRASDGVLATLSIEMWLLSAPAGFTGNVVKPEDLRRANAELDIAENLEVAKLSDVEIQHRTWLFKPSCGVYMVGLNRTIFVAARVSVAGNTPDDARWRDWADKTYDTIIGSLRVDRSSQQAAAVTPAS